MNIVQRHDPYLNLYIDNTPETFTPPRGTLAVTLRTIALTVVQGVELVLVGGVGLLVILVEYSDPLTVKIGLSLLLLPLLLRLLLTGRPTAPTQALWPLVWLALLTVVTVRITPAWNYTWPELARLLWGMALCLAVINWINPWPNRVVRQRNAGQQLPPRLLWATVAFFCFGAIFAAIGLLAMGPTHKIAFLDAWLALLPKLDFASGGFNPNRVAGVAILLAPLAVALAIGPLLPSRRSLATWFGWLVAKALTSFLALFFCAVLILTQSRGAWLAFGCAMLLILSRLGRRGWLLLGIGVVIVISAVVVIGPVRLIEQVTVTDLKQVEATALIQDRNVAGRLLLWQRALHGLADAPLTGMGLGAFAAVSQQPYPPLPAFQPDPDMSHVHNILLQVGVDLGVPGVVGFVALLGVIAQRLICLVRRTMTPSPLYTWSLGLLGSFLAYFLYNMVDAITLGARPAVAVWFLFGLCLGAGEWAHATVPKVQRRHRSTQPAFSQPLVAEYRQAYVNGAYNLNEQTAPLALPAPSTERQSVQTRLPQPAPDDWEERAWAIIAGNSDKSKVSDAYQTGDE